MTSILRLRDGFIQKAVPSNEHELTIHRLGNGHAEAGIRRTRHWEEICEADAEVLELWRVHREETADERREANRERAARRATTKVRRLVKVSGFDALLTLTYHADQQDLALCKKHLKEFVRRMRRLMPGWSYVAAFERQDRGTWHVHMAIHKLPLSLPASNGVKVKSYNIVRAVWRGVVGVLKGNIDQSRRRRHSGSSAAKVAAYISKYMLKAFRDGEDWKNRYSSGGLHALPVPVRVRFVGESMADLIGLAYSEIAMHACEIWAGVRHFGDSFFMTTSPPGPRASFDHG